jgi:uncharacterized protein (TIGR02246 family)
VTEYTTGADHTVRLTHDQELKALFQRMCQAWTDGDAAAYGACFTADCDYVSFDGTRAHGREQVVRSHDKLFRGVLFGSALRGEVESIRYIADNVAVLYGTGSVLVAWRTQLPKRRLTRNTVVAIQALTVGGSPLSITVGYAQCRYPSPILSRHKLRADSLHLLPKLASVGQQRILRAGARRPCETAARAAIERSHAEARLCVIARRPRP